MAFQGAIFDAEGVLVDSPHELARRDMRDCSIFAPDRFTPAVRHELSSRAGDAPIKIHVRGETAVLATGAQARFALQAS
ncbi:MAG: hypothetical protein ABSB70_11605 [Candidatus Velthaea sp.]|jgi:hypothetical protein